ncbi:MAG: ABC transporter ATP-binding protein [Candidatus Heimdallarchaeota archaeon]|nr:ABC transporter ATP-binding protein [Candidatus Heimdallarchaeota archaeon]
MSMHEKRLWGQLWIWLREDKLKIFFLSIVIILNVVVAVAGPLFLKEAIDLIELEDKTRDALFYTSLYALMMVLIFFSNMSQSMLVALVNAKFIHQLRSDAFSKVMNNSITFFDESISGKLVSRVVNDSNELASSAERLSHSFAQFFVFLGVLITMFTYDFMMTMASFIIVPLLLGAVISLRRIQRRISLRWRSKIAIVNANFGETMASISVSKSFGRETENLRKFVELNEQTYEASKTRALVVFAVAPVQDFLKNLGVIFLLLVASSMSSLSVSLLYMFVLLQGYLYEPISHIARAYNQFQNSFAALERLLEIMADDESQEDFNQDGLPADALTGKIEFRDFGFAYIEDEPVLRGIDLHIDPGTTVALVGHTGAGKSTIVSLLMRFYGGYSGNLLFDDREITEYQLLSLRKHVAYVAQDVFLFSGTIRDNLLFAKPDSTEQEINRALDAVQATEFLSTLPQGLDTVLAEEAKNLSQGQKQMISLARALLADPTILILDEFTSSLDLYTEAKIQQGITALIEGRTSIVVAHRLTTIMRADKIVVLEGGKILEEGTHSNLIEKRGKYAELFDQYFSFQVSDLTLKVIK